MSQEYLICSKQELVDIADAVRAKTGSTDTFVVGELPQAISEIETGGGGITSSDLCNVNWQVNDEYEVNIMYIGIDENNEVRHMFSSGNQGSFQCIRGLIEIESQRTAGAFGEDVYPNIDQVMINDYVGSVYTNGVDYSMAILNIFAMDSIELTITCSAPGIDWG
jgi:hypothetical protein